MHFRTPLFLTGLLAMRSAAATAGLDGIWQLDLPTNSGIELRSFLVLHGEGGSLTGTVYPNRAASMPLLHPRQEGQETVFEIGWDWTFWVHRSGDHLEVAMRDGFESPKRGVAIQITEADLAPPAPPPVPALRVLPSNGLAMTPPMGWNSWNHFAERVDDATVRAAADAIVASGMAAAGYRYVNIDDTWEGGRDPEGRLRPNRKFPDMRALANYLHHKGLKLGIYSSPGFVTCGGYEGSLGHEEQDARTFADWGIDYLKYDWCSAGRVFADEDLHPVYQKMGAALQRSGRAIVFSLCEYGVLAPWKWGAQAGGNLWRTTGDIHDNWKSMEEIGFAQSDLAKYAGPGHWNDPDMLEVGNGGMTATEYRTHFSLWCLLAAPLMAGNDVRTMTDETRAILTNREAIALDQDPLGIQGTRSFAKGSVEVWSKRLGGNGRAIGIFNRGDREASCTLQWSQVGLTAPPATVRDLWAHRDLVVSAGGLAVTTPSHGVTLLRIN
jgi:alpha-galactosidase